MPNKVLYELQTYRVELEAQNEELRLSQERLEESKDKYFDLYNLAPVGFFGLTEKGSIKEINVRGANLLETAPSFLVNRLFSDFVDKRDLPVYYSCRKKLETTDFQTCELRLMINKDSSLWVRADFFVGENRDRVLIAVSDISDVKRSEDDFQTLSVYHQRLNDISIVFSEAADCNDLFVKIAERFLFLTDAVASSFSVYDKENKILKPMFLSIDYEAKEQIDSLFGSEVLEMSFPVDDNVMDQMINGGIYRPLDGIHELSFGIVSKDISDRISKIVGYKNIVALSIVYAKELLGTCIAYLPSDNPIPDHALNIYSNFAGLAVKHKREEEALRKREEQYRILFDSASEGMGIVQDGVFKLVNNKFADMIGYTKEEIYSSSIATFLHSDSRKELKDRYERRIKGDVTDNTYQFKGITKQGETRTIETVTVLVEWEGRPATLDYYKDVTDEINILAERQRIEKIESIGLLAGGIAHDFNNILTSIIGNISLANEMFTVEDLRDTLVQVEKASQQARHLTRQLLTFSKGGAPITKLASLTELIKDTAGFALRGSNVKCRLSSSVDLWHAEIDEGQISQIVHNLVINAQQAMPKGGDIDIVAENITLDDYQGKKMLMSKGNYVKVSITDYGIGIKKDILNRIFDPFFTTKENGSGLGLATSFSIARQHGGRLGVKSQEGAGSTFYFYLPASVEISSIVSKKETPVKKNIGKYKILVMDDEKSIRDISGRMLKHLGYENVAFADSGGEAIKQYKKAIKDDSPFDVVILDLTIPGGLGGKDTVKKLKEIDSSVKAVVSSGYLDDEVILECQDYGFKGMISKPYTLSELGKMLQEVLS